jgi:hypothetical protein
VADHFDNLPFRAAPQGDRYGATGEGQYGCDGRVAYRKTGTPADLPELALRPALESKAPKDASGSAASDANVS